MLAVFLAGVVAVNVAVLQLNVRLDELGRERVQLRADTREARAPQLSSAAAAARIESLAGHAARLRSAPIPRPPSTSSWRRAEVTPKQSRPADPSAPLPLRARLRGHARAGSLAPGSAGLDARADGVAPAARDDRDSRRPRHDLRPDGRAARDRRADDHRLRRPARGARTRAPPRSRRPRSSASTRTSSTRCWPTARATSSTCSGRPIPPRPRELERRPARPRLLPEEQRFYPQKSVAAHVLGFAGVDNHGLEGLERSLDRPLAGKPGSQTVVKDPAGRAIDVIATKPRSRARTSCSRSTTDPGERRAVLRDTVVKWRAKGGTAIVLDPRNGAVLAMAVAPAFDANSFGKASPERRRTVPSPTSTSPARPSRS